ncbi:MAG: type II toxin-antitoxin system prevent-host-death family antitoxin [Caulobacteraceae bacterium]|nr:type II toxin-antitoxin system prevent-host-death family antitoxin [Caulobacteraceae bacterium]
MVQIGPLEWTVDIPVSEAKALLTELVRRAEAGEDIVLTRHGQPAARLVAARPRLDRAAKWALLQEIRAAGRAKPSPGPDAARSQDFLYDDDGLPG